MRIRCHTFLRCLFSNVQKDVAERWQGRKYSDVVREWRSDLRGDARKMLYDRVVAQLHVRVLFLAHFICTSLTNVCTV